MATCGFVADHPPLLPTSSPFLPPSLQFQSQPPLFQLPNLIPASFIPSSHSPQHFPHSSSPISPRLSTHKTPTGRPRWGWGLGGQTSHQQTPFCFFSKGSWYLISHWHFFFISVSNYIYLGYLKSDSHKTSSTLHVSVSQSIYSIIKVCSNNLDE